jgi:membrane-associated phospholipid phosphatase
MIRREDTVEKDAPRARGAQTVSDAGSTIDAGTTTEAGPLGRVDPASPAPPGSVPRPPLGLATLTVVVGFVGLIAMLLVLGSIAEGVRAQEVFALDTWATPFLHGIASPGLDTVMLRLTDLGSSLVLLPLFAATVAVLIWKHRYGAAVFLAVASGGSLLIDGAMKVLFERPRPQLSYAAVLPDYSFPSGHTMNALIFYLALALIIWSVFGRRIGLAALSIAAVLAIGVGVSRIYLGYHYLTDVVGGLLAGISWLLVVGAAFRARPKWWSWGDRQTSESRTSNGHGSAAVR